MYNLGEQFKRKQEDGIADSKCIYKGEKYRITILSERLVRLEYNESGKFLDAPTELVWNRVFDEPKFAAKEDNSYLEIKTPYFTLFYTKEKSFNSGALNPTANLKISVNNSDKFWHFNHPEVRNFPSPQDFLTVGKTKGKLQKSLFSTDGFCSIDDSKNKVFTVTGELAEREIQEIDTYVFVYLNDFDLCLKDYFKLTGKPGLIPRYALGNWWSKNEKYNEENVKKLVEAFEHNEIPLSILLLDKDWHKRKDLGHKKLSQSGFTFDKTLFENPVGMINFLHAKGIRLGLNVNPKEGLLNIDDFYDKAKNYLTPDNTDKIPFNVYDPKFIDVYIKLFIHPLDTIGTDFYWVDYYDENDSRSLFLLKHYQFYDMMRDYKRRPMILGYNGGLAAHRYPVLYSGRTVVSWDTLRAIPLHNAHASNIGVSWWSHDIGGFYRGIEDNELYARFVQLGVFSPIMKFGSDRGRYYKREPWRWNIKTYMIVQRYLQYRHQIIPYLYSEAYKYHMEGIPIVRPLYYKFPDMFDDPLYKNEYYFGGELFVSPIIKPKDYIMNRSIHKFFIPEGTWYDITTGKKFNGGKSYIAFFRDEDYPVFARSGAIIPVSNNEVINDTTPPVDLGIEIFPGRSNNYKLYEDDGLSDLYRKGFYLLTTIDYNYQKNNYSVVIKAVEGKSGIVPAKRNYKIRFRNTKAAYTVEAFFNNAAVPVKSWVDQLDFIIEINDISSIGQLTVTCKGKDIEIDAVRLINEDIRNI
ncbi:MAG: glycoside hydrolase family 31 protein, partial [Bacilli bacterium]